MIDIWITNESPAFVKKNDGGFFIISSNICHAQFSLKEVFLRHPVETWKTNLKPWKPIKTNMEPWKTNLVPSKLTRSCTEWLWWVQLVTGDSQEEVIIFRDTHCIIIYISPISSSPSPSSSPSSRPLPRWRTDSASAWTPPHVQRVWELHLQRRRPGCPQWALMLVV